MKNICFVGSLLTGTLCCILISANCLHGQGNLQFNQVLYLSTGTYTVPAGKTAKIEKVMAPDSSYIKFSATTGGTCTCSSSSGNARTMYVTTPISDFTQNNLVVNSKTFKFVDGSPLWLPAGTVIVPYTFTTPSQQSAPASPGCYSPYWIDNFYVACGPYTPPQVTVTSVVSIIEFNIVP